MEKTLIIFSLKAALIVASVGSFLRLIFFESWMRVISTFFFLTLSWTLLVLIFVIIVQRYFLEFYKVLFPSEEGSAEAAVESEEKSSDLMNMNHSLVSDEIDTDEIFSPTNDDTTPSPSATSSAISSADELPEEAKKDKKKKAKRNKSDEPIPTRELEQIKNFSSKEIAKAVKLMIGPDEDNPLIDPKK